MPSAPAASAICAARRGSGTAPPRALRSVATWSILTPRRSFGALFIGGPFAALSRPSLRGAPKGALTARPSSDHPFHAVDDRQRAQSRQHIGEMFQVEDLDFQNHFAEVRRFLVEFDVVDIGAHLADQTCHGAETARLV